MPFDSYMGVHDNDSFFTLAVVTYSSSEIGAGLTRPLVSEEERETISHLRY
jgi:hypothetical protein